MTTQTTIPPKKVKESIRAYRKNPVKWFHDYLGATTEIYQDRILDAIAKHDRIAVRACHDLGKSWTFARTVLWFALTHPYCKIITTAPTGRQVKHILWSELRSAHQSAKVPLGGKLLQTEWHLSEHGDWFALGFSPNKEASLPESQGQGTQSTFQGFHAPYILVLFDEATGVDKQIWDMAEGLLTSANVKFICIGNPTSSQSEFYRCFNNMFWHKIHLSCFDSPNLIANRVTDLELLRIEVEYLKTLGEVELQARIASYKIVKGHLLTLRWVVERAIKWGLTHPLFLSKALGEFPLESDNVHMPLGVVEKAQDREYTPVESEHRSLGVDVARFGSDSTVFHYMHGPKVIGRKVHTKLGVNEVTGEVIAYCRLMGWPQTLVVDETGVGGGVVDLLKEKQNFGPIHDRIPKHVRIMGIQFGGGFDDDPLSDDKERYVNVKAKMFDMLATALKTEIALPSDDVYLEELPTIIYKYDSKGRLKMESKDEYKKRTGLGSPDNADSLALANYGRQLGSNVGLFTKDMVPNKIQSLTGGLRGGDKW